MTQLRRVIKKKKGTQQLIREKSYSLSFSLSIGGALKKKTDAAGIEMKMKTASNGQGRYRK